MNAVFARIRSATGTPTPDERLRDIVDLHEAHPGITEATLGAWSTRAGLTGYDLLVREVPTDARAVLEIGAGNGPLLERLLRARPALERLVGVDLCAADLALARDRLTDPRVALVREPADALSAPDASFDAVLTHHVFYLLDPPEPAARHVARVLRPGGRFATAHWTFGDHRESLFAELVSAYSTLTRREVPHFAGWGDRRMFDRASLAALLADAGLAAGFAVDEHALAIDEPAARVCERLMAFFYSVHLLSPAARSALREQWTRMLAATDRGDGLAHLEFPFSIVRARKARP